MKLQGTGMIICPRCGTENPAGSLKCASCERVLVSESPVRMKPVYIGALAGWGLCFAAVGLFFFFYLDEATRQGAVYTTWIQVVRAPFDLICDYTKNYEWKRYWAPAALGIWTVVGAVCGFVIEKVRR